LIVDTDILIWYFRKSKAAASELLNAAPFSISSITLMELIQGAKNKREQNNIMKLIDVLGADIVHVNDSMSARALQYVKEYSLSHGLTIADALIAATAYDKRTELFTANTRHFKFIPGIALRKFKPI